MIAIGRCLLLFISLAGTTLSVDRFSKEDIAQFLDYIFRLNNAVRRKHNATPLTRSKKLDDIANKKMNDGLDSISLRNDSYNIIHNKMHYYDTPKLDVNDAINCFSLWYERGNFYDYTIEPDDKKKVSGFTQILWESTTEIGLTFGYKENEYIVIAAYNPAGNWEGYYRMNVHPPINNRPAIDLQIHGLSYQTGPERFLDYIFVLHNNARLKHGVPLLVRDDKLDIEARELIRRRINEKFEMNEMNYLERKSFYLNSLDIAEAQAVFTRWYYSGNLYNHDKEPKNNRTAPFTRIVWRNTERIGIAIQMKGPLYAVLVKYSPPGNKTNEFKSNVPRPISMDQGGFSGNY